MPTEIDRGGWACEYAVNIPWLINDARCAPRSVSDWWNIRRRGEGGGRGTVKEGGGRGIAGGGEIGGGLKTGVLLRCWELRFNWTDRNIVSRFYTSDSFVGTRLYLTSIILLLISGTIICREYLSLPACLIVLNGKNSSMPRNAAYIYVYTDLCNELIRGIFYLFIHAHSYAY